jgi:hypothetical protein
MYLRKELKTLQDILILNDSWALLYKLFPIMSKFSSFKFLNRVYYKRKTPLNPLSNRKVKKNHVSFLNYTFIYVFQAG